MRVQRTAVPDTGFKGLPAFHFYLFIPMSIQNALAIANTFRRITMIADRGMDADPEWKISEQDALDQIKVLAAQAADKLTKSQNDVAEAVRQITLNLQVLTNILERDPDVFKNASWRVEEELRATIGDINSIYLTAYGSPLLETQSES